MIEVNSASLFLLTSIRMYMISLMIMTKMSNEMACIKLKVPVMPIIFANENLPNMFANKDKEQEKMYNLPRILI